MKMTKYIQLFSILVIVSFSLYWGYNYFFKPPIKSFYTTTYPTRQTICQTVYATGILEIKDHIKIGSLVSGTVEKIFVKENDQVKKGQLLALIDNGKEDTQVKKSHAELEKAKAELVYQKAYLKRQKALFIANQLSHDAFEQVQRDYEQAESDVKVKQANLDFDKIEYENTKIKAAADGIIISVGVTIGQRITTDLDATVLFVIAQDITKMEAQLDIDESDIGQTKVGQKVNFAVGTYLDKTFKGSIKKICYSPHFKNSVLSYKAYMDVDNTNLLLRPGMTINAKIKVAKCNNALSISAQAFHINPKLLKAIAHTLQYHFEAINKEQKKIIEQDQKYPTKYVWIVKDSTFKEKAIKTKVTDEHYFEIKSGLTQHDKVITDIQEDDIMEKHYKKHFKGVL